MIGLLSAASDQHSSWQHLPLFSFNHLAFTRFSMINYFRVLGVKATATDEEIKKAYKRLSNKYHPDKLLSESDDAKDQAALQLQRVKEAYDVLSDAKKRAAFIKDFNNVIVPDPAAAMKELWDQYYPAG
jgi:DnaJ-domain-containing protein 1